MGRVWSGGDFSRGCSVRLKVVSSKKKGLSNLVNKTGRGESAWCVYVTDALAGAALTRGLQKEPLSSVVKTWKL